MKLPYFTERFRLPFHRSPADWSRPQTVSVLLPTHNRLPMLLERSLPSIVAQTHRYFEILVLAHGCTDGTVQTLLQAPCWGRIGLTWAQAALHVRVIEVPRELHFPDTPEGQWLAGPVKPLNLGLDLARGDWIARIDDDDIWLPDHLETALNVARERDCEFVSLGSENHRGFIKPYDVDGIPVGSCQTWVYRSYLRFMKYNPDCWKKRFDRVNDTDLQRRMVTAGVKMGYLPRVTCRVLPRPGNTEVGHAAL